MSRPDLAGALRAQTPAAPEQLRERVRLVAASAAPPPRPRWQRRALLLGVALAVLGGAVAAAVVLTPGPANRTAIEQLSRPPGAQRANVGSISTLTPATGTPHGAALKSPAATPFAPSASGPAAIVPTPTPGRAQRYTATLRLRLASSAAVEAAARRAIAIAQALGGYPQTVEINAVSATGTASLALAIPRQRVVTAVNELSVLGTVVGEHVGISDLQSGIDALGRSIVRLERELKAAERAPQTAKTKSLEAALTTQIEGLQRRRTTSQRSAAVATVTLVISTPHHSPPPRRPAAHPGPFHGLLVAFRDIGVGAVYALALGIPLALLGVLAWLVVSRLRRRREERLLSAS